jgi:hypothetical protein
MICFLYITMVAKWKMGNFEAIIIHWNVDEIGTIILKPYSSTYESQNYDFCLWIFAYLQMRTLASMPNDAMIWAYIFPL